MKTKYYLYRHIRHDKNEPFYIGIGTKIKNYTSNPTVEYQRAFTKIKKRRNTIWSKIIEKTDYSVEILFESNNYDFIKEKEKEFIKLYGRIDLKTGSLSNLTDGGEGSLNVSYNPIRAKKISDKNKGRIKSKEEREGIRLRQMKKVVHKESGEIFNSIIEAALYEGITSSALYQQLWSSSPICKFKYLDSSILISKNIKG